jgi:hypothetical protein
MTENSGGASSELPEHVRAYLKKFQGPARQKEEIACEHIQRHIQSESDLFLRQYMQDTLIHFCRDDSMLVSYIYETYWDEWISKERDLNRSTQPIDLYIQLERILASQSNSDGYLKGNDRGRYPLCIPGHHAGETKTRNVDKSAVSPSRFRGSYYKFGVHLFFVGHAIQQVLSYLQDRYGIDFGKLEEERNRTLGKPNSN